MKTNILVVDDEESIRYTFEAFLVEKGYTVFSAADFEEGLALLRDKEIDMIFADIILPGKSGLDLLRAVREIASGVPVIIITGAPSVDTAADSLRMGAFDYIVKPIRQEALLRSVAIALKHKALRDESDQCRLNLETIFRSVNDGIITVDENMAVQEVNDAAESICEFQRKQIVGKAPRDLSNFCEGNCFDALYETIKTRQPVKLRFIECRRSSGTHQVVSVTTSPLIDQKSRFSGAVMVVRDETRLVIMERRLKERERVDCIVGRSEEIETVRVMIRKLADVDTTVLITGNSGTGKELVVDALHHSGSRAAGPLVKLNCVALSESLLESELFGHVAGAFTGAVRKKIGRFERADGGTLFLDEIGEISQRMQLRLLRVIEKKEFERVGEATPIKVDVRLVAATNRDLEEAVASGQYREDLYYRLKVAQIQVPPLLKRRSDIPLLVEHFRRQFNRKLGRQIKGVSSEVEQMFFNYTWPGNVRELENLLEHAFVRCRQEVITTENLPPDFLRHFEAGALSGAPSPGVEIDSIRYAIKKAGGNKSEAARLLGISRRTIYRKMGKHGVDPPD